MFIAILFLVQLVLAQFEPTKVTKFQLANAQFSLDLLQKPSLCGWNCVFSPYSINSVLGMILAGAREGGETEKELLAALHLENYTPTRVHNLHQFRLDSVNRANSGKIELSTANNVYVNSNFKLSSSYSDIVNNFYAASPEALDFSNPTAAADSINEWIKEQTKGNIPRMLPASAIDVDTAAVIANAIYFKGEWKTKFVPEDTQINADFYVDRDVSVQVDMMHVEDSFCYKRLGDFDVIELPYDGEEVSMVILKPFVPLNEAVSNIRAEDLLINFLEFDYCDRVSIYLPKFAINLKVDLRQALEAINVTRVFNSMTAQLEGIIEDNARPLFISQALHEAKIEVDEEGTTASASTVAIVQFESAVIADTPEFRIDTPFFFMLYHKATRSVLFMGQIVNPVEEV